MCPFFFNHKKSGLDESALILSFFHGFQNHGLALGDQVGEKTTIESYKIDKISNMTYKDYAILLLQPNHASSGDKEIMFFSDFAINSVEGTLYLIEPRVEHTHE